MWRVLPSYPQQLAESPDGSRGEEEWERRKVRKSGENEKGGEETSLFSNVRMSGSETKGGEVRIVPLACVECKRLDSFLWIHVGSPGSVS